MAKSAVQSVDRAIGLLEQLAAGPAEGFGLSELARRCELRPQTAQSLLRTLEGRGMVTQPVKGGPYVLGYRLWELGRRWRAHRDPADVAGRVVKRAAETLGEYIILVELHERQLVTVAEVQADRSLSVRTQAPTPERFHTMATAKVLLAYAPADIRDAILATLTFRPSGPAAPSSVAKLRKQLKQVREQGHAVCIDESSAGVAAAAVPVFDEADKIVAAVGSSLPTVRFDEERQGEILRELHQAAGDLQQNWLPVRG